MTKQDDFFEPIELERNKKDWTEKDWAEYWKREQDAINDGFQKWKKKKDAEPKGKLVIRLDGDYFDGDTKLVIAFLKTVIKILNFASPLLTKFFPVAGPIFWITRGITALELLLKLKLVTRLKMELKHLDQEFADFAILGLRLINGVEGAMSDGKFEIIGDADEFGPAFKAIGPAIKDASKARLPKTPDELTELHELIKIELDLDDDGLEQKAEDALGFLLGLYKLLAK